MFLICLGQTIQNFDGRKHESGQTQYLEQWIGLASDCEGKRLRRDVAEANIWTKSIPDTLCALAKKNPVRK